MAVAVGRAMLASAPGRRKLDLIYGVKDPKGFVRRLPAEDLYFAIQDIGLADAADVIGLASPLQFRAFVDLDAWDRDLPAPERILDWLRLAREGAESAASLRRQKEALDRELILLVLRTQTRVHSLEENDSPVFESNNWVSTPDNKYIVEITAGEDEARTVRWLIEDFIDASPFEATRLFEAVRWEMQSELEETALRWRTGRLRDMGFPELDEALHIRRPLPSDWQPGAQTPERGVVAGVATLFLTGRTEGLFLDHVLEKLSDDGRASFNDGLLYLLNCAIVAEGLTPRELERAGPVVEGARGQLSLGLELLAGDDESFALELLRTTPATELYRRANTDLLALSQRANRAARRLGGNKQGLLLLDSPDAETLVGLKRVRPVLFDPAGPGEKRVGGDWRGFRTRAELAQARNVVARAEAASAVVERLGVLDHIDAIAEASNRAFGAISLAHVVLTTLARALLRLPPSAEPLAPVQVEALCGSFANGKLTSEALTLVNVLFDSISSSLTSEEKNVFASMSKDYVARLETEVGAPCAAGGLDARFVDGVLSRPAG